MSKTGRILVIDDDTDILSYVDSVLLAEGYNVRVCSDGTTGIAIAGEWCPDIVLLDILMPRPDGFQVLRELRNVLSLADTLIMALTSVDDQETLVRIIEAGAADFVSKPIRRHSLLARLRVLEQQRKRQSALRDEISVVAALNQRLRSGELQTPEFFAKVITADPEMYAIFQYAEAISKTSRPVLITGETGTGKEEMARIIHRASGRTGEFISVNVAGLDGTMFSDTLFGHVEGAFTGAAGARQGLIEKAADGTICLDEIGELDTAGQVKLLRLLQEGEYYQLGNDKRRVSTARVVVSTNRTLADLRESDDFRTDLFFRLSSHHIDIPPLRNRPMDLEILLGHFVRRSAESIGRPVPEIPAGLAQALATYTFPGNIRELEAMVFDAVSRSREESLSLLPFAAAVGDIDNLPAPAVTANLIDIQAGDLPTLKQAGEMLITEAMRRSDGNQSAAAKLLGITRQALNKRLSRAKSNDPE